MLKLAILLSLVGFSCGDSRFDVPDAGVREGAGLFDKQLFARRQELGEVTDIALGRVDGDDRVHLVLAGTYGFALLDPKSGEVVRCVPFEVTLPHPFERSQLECRIVDADGDGNFEFALLARGWGRTSLHGSDGKTIWSQLEPSAFNERTIETSAAADLDADGKLEFIIAVGATQRSATEVHLHDHTGKLKWSQPWSTGVQLVFLDVNHDGRNDIVSVDGNTLNARDASGNLLVQTRLPDAGYVSGLWQVRSWGDPPRDCLVVRDDTGKGKPGAVNHYLVSLDARTVGSRVEWDEIEPRIDAVPVDFPSAATVAWAKLNTLRQPAFMAGTKATRLRLRLSDRSGKLLYDEILMPPDGAVEVTDGAAFFRPPADGRMAQLLVAYGSCVWAYTAHE